MSAQEWILHGRNNRVAGSWLIMPHVLLASHLVLGKANACPFLIRKGVKVSLTKSAKVLETIVQPFACRKPSQCQTMSNYVELYQTPDCKLFGSLMSHVKGVHWGWKSNRCTLKLVDVDQNWIITFQLATRNPEQHTKGIRGRKWSLYQETMALPGTSVHHKCAQKLNTHLLEVVRKMREYVCIYLVRTR